MPPSSPPSQSSPKIDYTPELDRVLGDTGEECEMFSKLHLMAYKKFRKREVMFNLPIITITALIGFVSGLKLDFEYIHLILGGMSLYASLMKSYFSYLKISQKSENHRIAYIQYDQIHTEIRLELSLHPSIRKEASMLVDIMRIKLKNLREVSEIIDNSIINAYVNELKRGDMREMVELDKINRIKEVIKKQEHEKREKHENHENHELHEKEQPAEPEPNTNTNTNTNTNPPIRMRMGSPPLPLQSPQFRRSQQVTLKLSNPIQTYGEIHEDRNYIESQSQSQSHTPPPPPPQPPPKPRNVYCDYPEYSNTSSNANADSEASDDLETGVIRGTCV